MLVTAGYASAAALYGLFLTLNVVRNRRRLEVSLGDGSRESLIELMQLSAEEGPTALKDPKKTSPAASKYFKLTQAVRAHGNFIENAPWIYFLIALGEYNGMSAPLVHALGGAFLAGRIAHSFGILGNKHSVGLARALSMASTFLVIGVASVWNIVKLIQQ
ncbi:hypothetical protein HK105_202753 [Polyrhizophydium stewartii]|uniref:Glutathione transferase n=1 Tax=Polyrhizophydium stewartii TaxID=2732419 RepID=A0ABR4NEE8_9FUNG